jgi:hypothetical protein
VLVPAGLRVLFAPYDVGPWAEGKYDLLVPAAAVRPLLKPEFAGLLTEK